jgi:Ala-tRNA(Pro) deacylase
MTASESGDLRGIAAVTQYLDAAGVRYEVIEHEAVYTAADEAAAAGVDAPHAAKTLALHDHGGYRLAVIPASQRLDVDRAREALGADRHLRLATEDEIRDAFPSFDVGALPPFGSPLPVPEILDIRLLYRDRLLCAGGDHQHSILIDPRDVARLAEPRVADICARAPGEHRFADVPHP